MNRQKQATRTQEQPERVIIISLDAMGARDLEYMSKKKHFGKLMEKAALCNQVSSVYPTLTYPAHVSIVTGMKPKNHGVINNTCLQPNRPNPDWMWQRRFVKTTTLYDEARKAGWVTAGLLWPVTAKSKIKYNIPEVLANRPWQNQILVSARDSSLGYLLECNKRFGHLRDGVRQPALDNFVHQSALYTIRKYNPDLFMIHFTDLDTNRHIYGLDHEKTFAAMDRHDERLGEIIEALEETGDMEKTTIVVLGDHCQFNTSQVVYFNYLLKEKGYLKTKGDKIVSYQVIAKNCDGSCYIYLHPKERNNDTLKRQVTELFTELSKDMTYGIERIFTGAEAGELGADNECYLMLEAADSFYFLDEFETLTLPVNQVKKHKMKATHGYLPDKKDYKTFFMASGFGIKAGILYEEEMALYDEGPTLAKLMGLDLKNTDGRVIGEILY